VLALLRRPRGGIANWAADVRGALAGQGVELVVDDASWIPDQTAPKVSKQVTARLRDAAKGFDVVHALEYRAAWACGEAFGLRFPWLYTAYRMPKTRHPELIDRLCAARRGLAASRAVFDALNEVDCVNLEVLAPAAQAKAVDREAGRRALGASAATPCVLAMGQFTPDRGLESLSRAMPEVWAEHPSATLYLIGEGDDAPAFDDPRARVLPTWLDDPLPWIAGADVVVVPYRNAGWSRLAVEAMMLGVPVLLREEAGLAEIGVGGISTYGFRAEEELGPELARALGGELRRESVGLAGRAWAEDRLDLGRQAKRLAEVYRECAGAA
jgi:glycosyltransferase involved in cell wall biosynthesis